MIFDAHSELHSYILASIEKICDKGIQIFPLKYMIFSNFEISETSLSILSKIIREKNTDGTYYIEDNLLKNKLDSLIKCLMKEEYNAQINNFLKTI